jgi:hypothetical protein
VDQLNLDVERIGPFSEPSPETLQDGVRYGWMPAGLGPLKAQARFSAQAGARHQRAWISISITWANAESALVYLRKVTDHRRERLAAGQRPFGPGWSGTIVYVDHQGCQASRAALVDKSLDEEDPPKTEWLTWIQGPLLVEFVVNARAKEPDFGLEAAAFSVWKELQAEGFSCPPK